MATDRSTGLPLRPAEAIPLLNRLEQLITGRETKHHPHRAPQNHQIEHQRMLLQEIVAGHVPVIFASAAAPHPQGTIQGTTTDHAERKRRTQRFTFARDDQPLLDQGADLLTSIPIGQTQDIDYIAAADGAGEHHLGDESTSTRM